MTLSISSSALRSIPRQQTTASAHPRPAAHHAASTGWVPKGPPRYDLTKVPLSVVKARVQSLSTKELTSLQATLVQERKAASHAHDVPRTFDLERRIGVVKMALADKQTPNPALASLRQLSLPVFQAKAKASSMKDLFAMRTTLEHTYRQARLDETLPQNRDVIRKYDTVDELIRQRSGLDGGGE